MSGYKVAFGVAAVTLAIATVVLVASAFATDDSDEFGRVSVPGSEALQLPEGDVYVFYEEARSVGENESLPVPELSYLIRPRGEGERLELEGEGIFSEEIGIGGTTRTTIGKLEVPVEETYVVEVRARGATGPEPALTFGTPTLKAVLDGAGGVLSGAGGGLGLALLIAVATFLRRAMSREDERVTLPREAGSSDLDIGQTGFDAGQSGLESGKGDLDVGRSDF